MVQSGLGPWTNSDWQRIADTARKAGKVTASIPASAETRKESAKQLDKLREPGAAQFAQTISG